MARTIPFHSPSSPHHHDNTDCSVGHRIISNRIYTKSDKPLCPICGTLGTHEASKKI